MKTTASVNVTKAGNWNRLRIHMEHRQDLHHSNEFLNTDESKHLRQYNQHSVIDDFDNWTNARFMPYIKDHDKKAKKKGRYQFCNVKNFLTKTGTGRLYDAGSRDREMVVKLSNYDDWNDWLKKAETTVHKNRPDADAEQVVYKAVADGLSDYARQFNSRHQDINLFEFYTHMDEKGAPHIHARILPCVDRGQTAKGGIAKPSLSLNEALKKESGTTIKDRRGMLALMSKFNHEECLNAMDSVNHSIAENVPELKYEPFKLYRVKDGNEAVKTGIPHEQYVKQQEQLDQQKQQLEEQQKLLNQLRQQIATGQQARDDAETAKKKAEMAKKKADEQAKQNLRAARRYERQFHGFRDEAHDLVDLMNDTLSKVLQVGKNSNKAIKKFGIFAPDAVMQTLKSSSDPKARAFADYYFTGDNSTRLSKPYQDQVSQSVQAHNDHYTETASEAGHVKDNANKKLKSWDSYNQESESVLGHRLDGYGSQQSLDDEGGLDL